MTDIKKHLRSHVGEEGYTVCMHADDQVTTASMIAELPHGGRPLANVLLAWPCRSVYVPLYVGRDIAKPLEWDRFAELRPTHRRTLDALERDLLNDATDDDAWAAEAWRRVDEAIG